MANDNNDDVIELTAEQYYQDDYQQPPSGSRAAKLMLIVAILILVAVIGALTYAWQYWVGARQELAVLNSQVEETHARQQQLKNAMRETAAEIEHQKERIRVQQQRLQEQQQTIEKERAQVEMLNASVDESKTRFKAGEEMLRQRVEQAEERLSGSPDRWIGAEAKHLLIIAQQKLRFRQDVDAAVAAMEEAATVLEKGGDNLVPTRLVLDDEIATLKQVVIPDVETIENQLRELSRDVRNLPLRKVVYEKGAETAAETHPTAPAEAAPAPDWRRIAESGMQQLKSLVQITRHRPGDHHGITSLQQELIRQHLRLALDNARIALQREENDMYQGALLLATELFETYFENATDESRSFSTDIQLLRQHQISPPLPETGGALQQLTQLLEGSRR